MDWWIVIGLAVAIIGVIVVVRMWGWMDERIMASAPTMESRAAKAEASDCKHRRFTIYGSETWRAGIPGVGMDGPNVSCVDCGMEVPLGLFVTSVSQRLTDLEEKVNG